ncbi:MAG TPA: HEAT repeat domain-containing protein [Acidobacteriota bacterium]|nr:HEAT repeat domain-containing protein [Acidobacteriota bacterium]
MATEDLLNPAKYSVIERILENHARRPGAQPKATASPTFPQVSMGRQAEIALYPERLTEDELAWLVESKPGSRFVSLLSVSRINKEKTPQARIDSIELLGKLKRADLPDVTEVLCQSLKDESPIVRAAAVQALGQLGSNTDDVVTALKNATADSDEDVKTMAWHTLSQLGITPLESVEIPPLYWIETPPAESFRPVLVSHSATDPFGPTPVAKRYQKRRDFSDQEGGHRVGFVSVEEIGNWRLIFKAVARNQFKGLEIQAILYREGGTDEERLECVLKLEATEDPTWVGCELIVDEPEWFLDAKRDGKIGFEPALNQK